MGVAKDCRDAHGEVPCKDPTTACECPTLRGYDRESEMITLSPTGAQEVEEKILREVKTRA
jgi:hypothetical protein